MTPPKSEYCTCDAEYVPDPDPRWAACSWTIEHKTGCRWTEDPRYAHNNKCCVCGKQATQWAPGGFLCDECCDDGTGGCTT